MDLHKTLTAEHIQDLGNLLTKLNARTTLAAIAIFSAKSHTRIAKSALPPRFQRYQNLFTLKIMGMDPLETFIPSKFSVYNGKSDMRSHY